MAAGEGSRAGPPTLPEALAEWIAEPTPERTIRVYGVLLRSELFVPVVALPPESQRLRPLRAVGDTAPPATTARLEMALATLVSRDGRSALAAFTSPEALRRWRPDAEPRQFAAQEVFATAVRDGHPSVVIDVAGPINFTVTDNALRDLASGRLPQALVDPFSSAGIEGGLSGVARAPEHDPELVAVLRQALGDEPIVAEAYLLAPEGGADASDVAVGLVLGTEISAAALVELVRRLAEVLGPSPVIRHGLDVAVLSPAQRAEALQLGPPVYRSDDARVEG